MHAKERCSRPTPARMTRLPGMGSEHLGQQIAFECGKGCAAALTRPWQVDFQVVAALKSTILDSLHAVHAI